MSDPMTHEVNVYYREGTMTFQANLTFAGVGTPGQSRQEDLTDYFEEMIAQAFPESIHVSVFSLD